jgi:tetratricopeptide (TPR) repeat protein
MLALFYALLVNPALAAAPRAYVVGLHVPGLMGEAPSEAADALTKALDDTGKVDALGPSETSKVISGREALILDGYALGPGQARLQEGRILYDRAQPDQAIEVLEDAADQLAAGLSVSTDVRSLHEALMLLGVSYVGLGDEDSARVAFRRSAILDPSRELDAVNYPPSVVSLFNDVRASVAREASGRISVSASMDAEVFVDGKSRGAVSDTPIVLVPGTHYVLVRAANGASQFESVVLKPGGSAKVDALLEQRTVGVAAEEASGRVRQTRDLYKAVGQYATGGLVVFGGVTAKGDVALQLYSPASGNFSKILTADAGDDPVGAILDLAPALVAYVSDNGDVRSDRVGGTVCALDVGSNDVLAGLLYDPPKASVAQDSARGGPKWYVWAGIGAAVVGGGAAATAVALSSGEDPGPQGTVSFGPIP